MFDIGWSELVVIAIVAILVVGPKDLPSMLRTVGKTVGNLRRMAGDFQRQFDQALREAELDEVKKEIKAPFQPLEDARNSAKAFQKQVSDSVAELGESAKPEPAAKPEAASGSDPAAAPAPVAAPAPDKPTGEKEAAQSPESQR